MKKKLKNMAENGNEEKCDEFLANLSLDDIVDIEIELLGGL